MSLERYSFQEMILRFVIFIVETTLKPIANVIFKGIQC